MFISNVILLVHNLNWILIRAIVKFANYYVIFFLISENWVWDFMVDSLVVSFVTDGYAVDEWCYLCSSFLCGWIIPMFVLYGIVVKWHIVITHHHVTKISVLLDASTYCIVWCLVCVYIVIFIFCAVENLFIVFCCLVVV